MLQNLVEPVHQLDVGVAAQLAEDGRALDRLVGERIELAEQRGARDLKHGGLRGVAGTRSRAEGAGRGDRAAVRRGRSRS